MCARIYIYSAWHANAKLMFECQGTCVCNASMQMTLYARGIDVYVHMHIHKHVIIHMYVYIHTYICILMYAEFCGLFVQQARATGMLACVGRHDATKCL